MKRRLLVMLAAVAAASPLGASAQQYRYGWTISKSSTDPFVNTGAPTPGIDNLFLWFQCSTVDGLAAVDFVVNVEPPGSIAILAFTPSNGFLNAGSPTALLLAVGGCPAGPVLAGNWIVNRSSAGALCFGPGITFPTPVAVDCALDPQAYECDFIGYDDNGSPCEHYVSGVALCQTTAVEDTSWGAIKSLYR